MTQGNGETRDGRVRVVTKRCVSLAYGTFDMKVWFD